jgi:hypothetical protein
MSAVNLTEAQARVSAIVLCQTFANSEDLQAVKDMALIGVAGRHGLESLLEVTAVACELLVQVLDVYATTDADLDTVLAGLRRLLESEAEPLWVLS